MKNREAVKTSCHWPNYSSTLYFSFNSLINCINLRKSVKRNELGVNNNNKHSFNIKSKTVSEIKCFGTTGIFVINALSRYCLKALDSYVSN